MSVLDLDTDDTVSRQYMDACHAANVGNHVGPMSMQRLLARERRDQYEN